MAYAVLLSEQAKEEIVTIKKSGDKTTIKKITNMLLELQEDVAERCMYAVAACASGRLRAR